MNLCLCVFSFSVTLTFVPIYHQYHQAYAIEDDHSNKKYQHNKALYGPQISFHKFSNHNQSNAFRRVKRSLHRPEKWEAIANEFYRPPKSRRSTRFYLYTRRNREKNQELCIDDHESLRRSNFDPNKRVVFLISGWLDNRFFAKWVREATRHLLDRGDFNVIYVAWRSIKELFVAAILIKVYSEDLAQFINFVKHASSISGHSIHCIGHSLGAFLCAFAGDVTHIGRISVLDAGPRPWYQNQHWSKRINRYQSDFIDVIHSDFSDGFSLGLTIPLGDVDFFPNAGTIQDGCWRDKWYKAYRELRDEGLLVGLDQMARYVMFCSHYRSHEWFFESIWNRDCQFVGVLCPNYQMFRDGECSCEDIRSSGHAESTCALMGYDAEYAMLKQGLNKYSPQGKWYLKTSDFVPKTNQHCEFQYQLMIKIDALSPSPQNGTFVVTIVADDASYSHSHSLASQQLQVQLHNHHHPHHSHHHSHRSRVMHQEVVQPPSYGLRSHYRVTKLVLRPHSLQLSRIRGLYLSYHTAGEKHCNLSRWPSLLTVPWVKLSPIHVLNNEPIYFCHLRHTIEPDRSNFFYRCPS